MSYDDRATSEDVEAAMSGASQATIREVQRRHDRDCATCDTCRGVWCKAAVAEVRVATIGRQAQ